VNPFDEYGKALIRWLLMVVVGVCFAMLLTLLTLRA